MVYSYDERKIGSYFGEDLYEKSFNISSENYESGMYIIDLGESADKVIDCSGFLNKLNSAYNLKLQLNTFPNDNITLNTSQLYPLYVEMYDRSITDDAVNNAAVYIRTQNTDYNNATGIIKVQYTKKVTE